MENENKISLLQYYIQHFASFCIQYGKPNLRLSKKVIHQLRVDIKNMRAIFGLLKIAGFESSTLEKNIIVLEKLFKAAGNVREEQVNLSIAGRYFYPNSLALYKKYLYKRKRSAFWTLHKALNEFNLICGEISVEESDVITGSNTRDEIHRQVQSYIQKGIKRVKKLYQVYSAKNLHNIRKELKDLSTVAIFSNEIAQDKKLMKLHNKLKPLEILMGVWHNRIVLQNSIEQFLTKDESFPEVLMLKKLIRIIKKQNKKTIKQIDSKMGKIFG